MFERFRLSCIVVFVGLFCRATRPALAAASPSTLPIPDDLDARADSSWFHVANKTRNRNVNAGVEHLNRYVAWHEASILTGRCADAKILLWKQPGRRGFADEHRQIYFSLLKAMQRQMLFFAFTPSWISVITPIWGWEWIAFLREHHARCGLPQDPLEAESDPRVIIYTEGDEPARLKALPSYSISGPSMSKWRSMFFLPSPSVQRLLDRNLALLGSPFIGVHIRTGAADSMKPHPLETDIPKKNGNRGFQPGHEAHFLARVEAMQSRYAALMSSASKGTTVRVFLASDLPSLIPIFEQRLGQQVVITTPGPIAHTQQPGSDEGMLKALADWFTLSNAHAAVVTFNSFFGITATEALKSSLVDGDSWRYEAVKLPELPPPSAAVQRDL